jgi:hypothetical protein
MLKLLERNIASIEQRLVIVSPPSQADPTFGDVQVDAAAHRRLLREMQKLRGSIYLHDGAVSREQLSRDGLHMTPEDERSWHLLMLGPRGKVSACVWYMEHADDASFEQLRVRNSPLAKQQRWRGLLWKAVDAELTRARRHNLRYAEVGGWAVSKENRCTSEGLLLALAAYSLGRVTGGALGMTTATVRHSSSTILRRLGGSSLEADGVSVPDYYDPKYKCQMELLRFDSRRPNAKYSGLIDQLKDKLAQVCVLTADPVPALAPSMAWQTPSVAAKPLAAA